MPLKNFNCKQCGCCCKEVPGAYANSVCSEDIRLWLKQGREDILRWVVGCDTAFGYYLYYLWFDPETGDPADGCPWLKELSNGKHSCLIHDVKPRHCRDWPLTRKDMEFSCCMDKT